jgi:hypothetical protein
MYATTNFVDLNQCVKASTTWHNAIIKYITVCKFFHLRFGADDGQIAISIIYCRRRDSSALRQKYFSTVRGVAEMHHRHVLAGCLSRLTE